MKLQNLINMLIGIVCIGLLRGAQAVVRRLTQAPPRLKWELQHTRHGRIRKPRCSFQMQAKLPSEI